MDCSLGQDGIAVVLCCAVHLDTVGTPYFAKQGLHRQACGYCGQVKLRSTHILIPLDLNVLNAKLCQDVFVLY